VVFVCADSSDAKKSARVARKKGSGNAGFWKRRSKAAGKKPPRAIRASSALAAW